MRRLARDGHVGGVDDLGCRIEVYKKFVDQAFGEIIAIIGHRPEECRRILLARLARGRS